MNTYDNWEEFEAGPNRPNDKKLHVSLNYKGQILLNKLALEALGRPEAVTLLFETRRVKIGIRGCSLKNVKAFPLKTRKGAKSKVVLASPFCRNYGIKVHGTVAFHSIEVDGERMMILDLAKTAKVSRVVGRRR